MISWEKASIYNFLIIFFEKIGIRRKEKQSST